MNSIYILDTSAILHARNVLALLELGNLVTTNYVINELKDIRAQAMSEVLNITVYDISENEIKDTRMRLHIPRSLSDTDVSLIALALKLKNLDPIVITDDSLLINFLRKFSIKYRVVFLRKRH